MERNFGCRILEYSIYGYKAVTIENEYLRVSFLTDKGCDIFELLNKKKDVDFMWRSPAGLQALKKRIGTASSSHGNFLDYYVGGWQEILPHGSAADIYKGAELGFHGEAALIPWEYSIVEDSPDCVKILCWTRLKRVPFLIEKEFMLKKEESILYIKEKVKNESSVPLEFMWGNHPAIGGGFLDENCKIILPSCTVVNGDSSENSRIKAGAAGSMDKFPSKEQGFIDLTKIPPFGSGISEMLFIKDLEEGEYTLKNDRINTAIKFTWDAKVMPYLWLWMEFNGDKNYPWFGSAYTLALEPFSSPVPTITKTISEGYSLNLNRGESMNFWINVNVFNF